MGIPTSNLYTGQTATFRGRLYEYYNNVWVNKNDITPFHHWTMNDNSDSELMPDWGMYPSMLLKTGSTIDSQSGKIQYSRDFSSGSYYTGYTWQHVASGSTLSFWIKLNSYPSSSNYYIFEMFNNAGNTSFAVYIDTNDNLRNVWGQIDTTYVNISNIMDTDVWYFICVTNTLSDKKTYINGIEVVNYSDSLSAQYYDKKHQIMIGRDFDGYLEDVRYYNRSLTVEEISAIYNKGKGTYSQSYYGGSSQIGIPKYWFKFNEYLNTAVGEWEDYNVYNYSNVGGTDSQLMVYDNYGTAVLCDTTGNTGGRQYDSDYISGNPMYRFWHFMNGGGGDNEEATSSPGFWMSGSTFDIGNNFSLSFWIKDNKLWGYFLEGNIGCCTSSADHYLVGEYTGNTSSRIYTGSTITWDYEESHPDDDKNASWNSCDCSYDGHYMVACTWSGRTHIYQLKEPGTASENTTSGTKQWEDKDGIKTEGDKYAHVELLRGGDEISYIIQATNFNFDIPDRSVIVGIRAVYKFMQYSNTSSYGISSCFVKIMKGGGIVGTDHADSGDYWDDSDWEYRNYGSETDLWGTAWTYSDIRDIGFGVSLQAQQNVGGYSEARIDHVAIYVYYIPPPDINGVYVSLDTGMTWTNITPPTDGSWNTCSIAGDLSPTKILCGSSSVTEDDAGKLYLIQHSAGSTTKVLQTPGGSDEVWMCSAIDSDASVLMVGSFIDSDSSGGYLYTGYTSGTSGVWYKIYPAGDVQKNWIGCDVNYNGSIMIACVNSGRIYTGSTTGSWYEVYPAGPYNKSWKCCACNYNGQIMVACEYPNGGVYVSYDRGLTWDTYGMVEDWKSCSISKDSSSIVYNVILIASSDNTYIMDNSNKTWISWFGGDTTNTYPNWIGDLSGQGTYGQIGVYNYGDIGGDPIFQWDLDSETKFLWKNAWHHIVLTQDYTGTTNGTGEIILYYDGKKQTSESISVNVTSGSGISIGSRFNNVSRNNFYISDLRLYDYVLHHNEVKNIYNEGKGLSY